MSVINPDAFDAELRERVAAAVAATLAHRQARRQQRAEFAERRTAGLRQRHTTKLARDEKPLLQSSNRTTTRPEEKALLVPPPPPSVPASSLRAAAPVTPVADRNRGVPGPDEQALLRGSLGAALRRHRAAHRLSQRALAALVGCHPRTVERLEAGQLRPTTALVAALAHALAVPPGWSPNGRREQVAALRAELAAAAGPSLVLSTPGGARRRRRRLRKARLAANHAALPALRARHGLQPQRQAARAVPADVAAAVRRFR